VYGLNEQQIAALPQFTVRNTWVAKPYYLKDYSSGDDDSDYEPAEQPAVAAAAAPVEYGSNGNVLHGRTQAVTTVAAVRASSVARFGSLKACAKAAAAARTAAYEAELAVFDAQDNERKLRESRAAWCAERERRDAATDEAHEAAIAAAGPAPPPPEGV
jgi:hypothetical protein